MGNKQIRTAIEGAIGYLSDNPAEARYTDSPATAVIDGLRSTVTGTNGEELVTDMPESVGGGDSAPSPGWMMRAAIASCEATLIAMRAAHLGIDLTQLEVTVDSESDDRGILGMDDDILAGPLWARIGVKIAANGSSAEELQEIVAWADQHCPVSDSLQRAIPTTVEVEIL
ncbi:MAG: OsmC family protein [Acidimicrobiia bacterium]|nr:OsmC family protein [Acidimicrobiia bacterium]